MERYVQFIALGGVTLLAGLWLVALATPWSAPSTLGLVLAAIGASGLVYGTATRIDNVFGRR